MGLEENVILYDMAAAIKLKITARVADAVGRADVVSLMDEPHTRPSGITILLWQRFLEEVWAGALTGG